MWAMLTVSRISRAHFQKNKSGRKKKVGAKYAMPAFLAHLPTFSKMGFSQKWAVQSVDTVSFAHMPTSPTFKKLILNLKWKATMLESLFDAVLAQPLAPTEKTTTALPLPPIKVASKSESAAASSLPELEHAKRLMIWCPDQRKKRHCWHCTRCPHMRGCGAWRVVAKWVEGYGNCGPPWTLELVERRLVDADYHRHAGTSAVRF